MKTTKLSELKSNGIAALIYAAPKTGKTYSLKHLKGKILIIDIDYGTSVLKEFDDLDIEIAHITEDEPISKLLDELESMETVPYKTIVLDSITELENQILTNLGKKGKNNGVPELGHYQSVDFRIADISRRLRNLTAKGVNIIITAWEAVGEMVAPTGEKTSIVKPMIRKPDLLCGLMSIVARLEVSSRDGSTRYFRFKGTNVMYAGDRIYKRDFAEVDDLFNDKDKTKENN